MKISRFKIVFNTPAFLGNADQSGQWRTPPFKAQLRQWWRMAYAHRQGFKVNIDEMRKAEGRLFGYAGGDDGKDDKVAAEKSRMRIRLEHWDKGQLENWKDSGQKVDHPEVEKTKCKVDPNLYLGFGPLKISQGKTQLKANAAIQAGEQAQLSIAYPEGDSELIERALYLMHRFGTVGGRSRNGWGSYSLLPIEGTPDLLKFDPLEGWQQALKQDWPHALGKDQKGPLIWQTQSYDRQKGNDKHDAWREVMRQLAQTKIGLRTQFSFRSGRKAPEPEQRHWLSYPVANHSVDQWGETSRLPNSLRFKVVSDGDGLRGLIFHVPCSPPPKPFKPDLNAIEKVWQSVHAFLDDPKHKLTRISG